MMQEKKNEKIPQKPKFLRRTLILISEKVNKRQKGVG